MLEPHLAKKDVVFVITRIQVVLGGGPPLVMFGTIPDQPRILAWFNDKVLWHMMGMGQDPHQPRETGQHMAIIPPWSYCMVFIQLYHTPIEKCTSSLNVGWSILHDSIETHHFLELLSIKMELWFFECVIRSWKVQCILSHQLFPAFKVWYLYKCITLEKNMFLILYMWGELYFMTII